MNPGHITTLFLLILSLAYCNGYSMFANLGRDAFEEGQEAQTRAVNDLIQRLLPNTSNLFTVRVEFTMKRNDLDIFTLFKSEEDSSVQIKASSGVAAAAAVHHYLKFYCGCHVSWDSHQLNLGKCIRGAVDEEIVFNDKYRYYQNACTPSYSFVWYDWPAWERHIDWMMLQGFNLLPVTNGQEAIWKRVYGKLGLTTAEIDEHLSGPAFLAWLRMGNMRGFGGPLSASWHRHQLQLNHLIIKRLRSFGATTILPAFAGHVPRAFKRIYPNSTYYDLPDWNGFNDTFCCAYLLAPTDQLFQTVGNAFLTEMVNEFGTDHIYACDTFNEMTPHTTDESELRTIGAAIYTSMTAIDPEAIWLMQGWLFHHELLFWTPSRARALLTAAPIGKMIILDLQSEQFPQYERLNNYFGQPYIWCMLHNFGGTLGMFGSPDTINTEVFKARSMVNSTLIGTGISPEGIDQNYVMYALMNEMAWRKHPVNMADWFRNYTIQRYGAENENVINAWHILRNTTYNYYTQLPMRGKYVYNRSPSTRITPIKWYEVSDLAPAAELFFHEWQLVANDNYRHDLIDINRQLGQNIMDEIYKLLMCAFRNKDLTQFLVHKHDFLKSFDQVEQILVYDDKWLLGRWLNAAKNLSDNPHDRQLFEYNARNQITLWGPRGEIKDYANKQWSGVVDDFFKPRWTLFLQHMEDALRHGVKFNENAAKKDVFEKVEEPFTFATKEYPDVPVPMPHTREFFDGQFGWIEEKLRANQCRELKAKRRN